MAADFLQGPDLDIPDIKVKYESPQSLKELEDVVKMKMTQTGSSEDDGVKMKITQTGSQEDVVKMKMTPTSQDDVVKMKMTPTSQDDGVKMFCGETVKPGVGPGVLIGQLINYINEF